MPKAATKKKPAKTTRKTASDAQIAKVSSEGSATTAKPNKSEAIRAYKKDNPDAKPKAIAEALTKAGIEVSPGFVSTILTKSKPKRRGRPVGSKNKKPSANGHSVTNGNGTANGQSMSNGNGHGMLDSAFDFVAKVGGLTHADALIAKLKEWKDKL